MDKSKNILISILLIISLIFAGFLFSENRQLKGKIRIMESQLESKTREVDELYATWTAKNLSINYVKYNSKKRFIPKELPLLALPKKNSAELRCILANTVVEVEDAAYTENQDDLWLYVVVPVYDSPDSMKGWVKESDTLPFTKENQELVQSDVMIKKGVSIYEVESFEMISSAVPLKSDGERGRLVEKREGYAKILCPGGRDIWVEQKFIVYPSL